MRRMPKPGTSSAGRDSARLSTDELDALCTSSWAVKGSSRQTIYTCGTSTSACWVMDSLTIGGRGPHCKACWPGASVCNTPAHEMYFLQQTG